MVKQSKYVVKKNFQGLPNRDDFEVIQTELPPIKGGEILVKAEWISVDPTMRMTSNRGPAPYDQVGYQVALVMESKDPEFPVGSRIVNNLGWCDYSIIRPVNLTLSNGLYKFPNLKGLPNSLAVGAIGMPGATAYFGFLELCRPAAGETVVVTGAAGAVGSLVGQIAKIKGCKVIGFAGSDDKVEWLMKDLGFDRALNYKKVDVTSALEEAAPNGVDCYFDNVGGEISSQILLYMNLRGRVAVCGSISSYNEDQKKLPKATILQPSIVVKQLRIEGFHVARWRSQWPEAFAQLTKWVTSGQLKIREHITEGFDNIFDAFRGMLVGENFGKAVVRV